MGKLIGKVTHYYGRIGVAVLELYAELELGDEVQFLGHTTDFSQTVHSLEIEHHKIDAAGPGSEVALKVAERVRRGDEIYLLEESESIDLLDELFGIKEK